MFPPERPNLFGSVLLFARRVVDFVRGREEQGRGEGRTREEGGGGSKPADLAALP